MERSGLRVLGAITAVGILTVQLACAGQARAAVNSQAGFVTKVIRLKYLAAVDVTKFLEPVLSPGGSISALPEAGRTRVGFGTRIWAAETQRSRVIAVRDRPAVIADVERFFSEPDKRPRQVMIDVKIVEVQLNRD